MFYSHTTQLDLRPPANNSYLHWTIVQTSIWHCINEFTGEKKYLPENVKLYQRLWNYFFLLDETAVLFCKLWKCTKISNCLSTMVSYSYNFVKLRRGSRNVSKGNWAGRQKRGWIVIELNCKFCKKNHVIHVQNMHKKQTNI